MVYRKVISTYEMTFERCKEISAAEHIALRNKYEVRIKKQIQWLIENRLEYFEIDTDRFLEKKKDLENHKIVVINILKRYCPEKNIECELIKGKTRQGAGTDYSGVYDSGYDVKNYSYRIIVEQDPLSIEFNRN